jgi:hypothetical protein
LSSCGVDLVAGVAGPGSCLVVEGSRLQAAVQDPDEPVGELARRGLYLARSPSFQEPASNATCELPGGRGLSGNRLEHALTVCNHAGLSRPSGAPHRSASELRPPGLVGAQISHFSASRGLAGDQE